MTNAMKHSNYNNQVLLFYLITLTFYCLTKRYARMLRVCYITRYVQMYQQIPKLYL